MDYTQTAGEFNAQELKQSLHNVRQDVTQLASQLQVGYHQLDTQLRRVAAEKPLLVVGAAFGVGFVLGGGVFSRIFAAALAAGVRATLAQSLPSIPSLLFPQQGDSETTTAAQTAQPQTRPGSYGV